MATRSRLFAPTRRDFLRSAAAGSCAISMSGWLPQLAAAAAGDPARRRSCILLWMTGGPSQMDTFDLKPGHENGGPVKPIDTSVPGIQISEHFPQLAKMMEHLTLIRSMSTKEGDHSRGTYLMRTGRLPQGPIQYPSLGSVLSKELAPPEAELPNYISIAPVRFLSPAALSPGFLGPKYGPMIVGADNARVVAEGEGANAQLLQVSNISSPMGVSVAQADARLSLLNGLESTFSSQRPGVSVTSHRTAYEQAVRMMRSEAVSAFKLDDEAAEVRDRYGRNQFGEGCLMARRLVERGVPFVEVSLNSATDGQNAIGWDTHQNNFEGVKSLCGVLDPAWAALMTDLKDRGLLDTTLVVWMGEFGRTPKINESAGRDHFPGAWSTVIGGGGVKGGQVIGKTSDDGMEVADRPIAVPDLLATVCRAVGVDPAIQNMSNVGRPIRLVDPEAKPIEEALA